MATLGSVLSPQSALQFTHHLLYGSRTGLLRRAALVGDCNRRLTVQANFQQAPIVVAPRFLRVLVTRVDFDAADLVAKARKPILDMRFDLCNEGIMTVDVVIRIHLN